jgi:glyoxylase I family protein
MKINHVAILVSDLARAEAFYCGTLGLPLLRRWTDDQGRPRSLWLALEEGAFLAIELGDGDGPRAHCVALTIPRAERDAWRARLVVEKETAYTLYTLDPDGNRVALSHWPDAV